MKRARAFVLCLVCLVSIVSGAFSREPPLVVLVLDGGPGAMHRRLEAELVGLGFRVVTDLGTGALAGRGRERKADAAVRVSRSRRAVEVWVTDPDRSKSAARDLELSGSGVDDAVLAVRVVELLRAAFLEIHVEMPPPPAASSAAASTSSAPPPASSSAPPVASSAPPLASSAPALASSSPLPPAIPPPPRFHAALGVVGSLSPGGVSPDVHVAASVGLDLGRRWRADVFGAAPGFVGRVKDGGDTTSFRAALVGLEGARAFGGAETQARLGAGVSAVRVRASGDASSAFDAGTDGAWVAWPFLRAGVARRLGGALSLVGDLRAGPTFPEVEVRFGARTVAHWGRPLVLPGVGLEGAL